MIAKMQMQNWEFLDSFENPNDMARSFEDTMKTFENIFSLLKK